MEKKKIDLGSIAEETGKVQLHYGIKRERVW